MEDECCLFVHKCTLFERQNIVLKRTRPASEPTRVQDDVEHIHTARSICNCTVQNEVTLEDNEQSAMKMSSNLESLDSSMEIFERVRLTRHTKVYRRSRSVSAILTDRTLFTSSSVPETENKLRRLQRDIQRHALGVDRWIALSNHAERSRRDPISTEISYKQREKLVETDPARLRWIYLYCEPSRKLTGLHINQLRLEELGLLKEYYAIQSDHLRKPEPYWYERCDPQFTREMHRHNNYLNRELAHLYRNELRRCRQEIRKIDRVANTISRMTAQ